MKKIYLYKLIFSILLLCLTFFLIIDTFYLQKLFLTGLMPYLLFITIIWIFLLIIVFIIKFFIKKK